jgi:hypothetical protein
MEPVTMIMAGSAIAGGLSSIFGGFGQAAQMKAQIQQQLENTRVENQRALNGWVRGNNQKAFNNGKEQFDAANKWVQQMKRNQAIDKAAYEYQWDAKQALRFSGIQQQQELSNALERQRGSLFNAIASRGIGTSSGMYASMALAQSLDALQSASTLDYNIKTEMKNIDRETAKMQSQKTSDIFIGNMQQWDDIPILASTASSDGGAGGMAILGGLIGGGAQIGGAFGGMALDK